MPPAISRIALVLIAGVDEALRVLDDALSDSADPDSVPHAVRAELVQGALERLRGRIGKEKLDAEAVEQEISSGRFRDALLDLVRIELGRGVVKAVNATGVVLHTNLGRAPVHPEAAERMRIAASSYCVLEMDRFSAKRNERDARLGVLLSRLTGAERIAGRVNQRARIGAALAALNTTLLTAGVAAITFRAFFTTGAADRDRQVVGGLFVAGALVGAWFGWRRARRLTPVGSGDAAWALDRLAGAGGRGIAAAVGEGAAAAEAAWGENAVAPPERVVLHPPRGLVATVAALGLFALAMLVPGRAGAPQAGRTVLGSAGSGAATATGEAGAAEAHAAEAEARALDDRAEAARRVRRILNLPADGPLDPVEVAERLADAAARQKAVAAAAPGTPLSEALESGDTPGEALARLLAASETAPAAASGRRRDAARARARLGDRIPVPPGRRTLVTRYLTHLRD